MLDVLLVDDDDTIRASIADALACAGHDVVQARDGEEALVTLGSRAFDLAVCDVQMPRVDGLTLLRRLRQSTPNTAVVVMTSYGEIQDAVGALRAGAVDYVTKPFDPDEFVRTVVRPIDERRSLMKDFERARAKFIAREAGAGMVGGSIAMREVTERLGVVAKSDVSVVVSGEAGTGKKLTARTLHAGGPRRSGPLVVVPCESLPELMLEAESRDLAEMRSRAERDAWFRAAEGGTIVLDGIDEIPPSAQRALLRIIDEPTLHARRGRDWQPLGVRIISLSREAPERLLGERRFLKPLFFRLNAMQLRLPRLREREGDTYLLVSHFLRERTAPGHGIPNLTPAAWQALMAYDFPGNVRELGWVMEHAVTESGGGEIDREHLPRAILEATAAE